MKKYTIILAMLVFAGLQLILTNNAFADSPIITGIGDITAEATSSSGAFVTFAPTSADATSSIPVICTPVSGSLFALGTTTVNCNASNSDATTTATFNVIVADKTSPNITPPADQAFATNTFPAFPALTFATATDTVDLNPIISYDPKSFPLGTTTVTWIATDGSGNSSATTSQVIITDNSSPALDTATIAIRDNGKFIGPFTVNLPATGSPDVSLSPTGTTTSYAISARSVLALLSSIDTATSSFDITDLQYFSSFDSFLVNCISVPEASSTPDCYNWTYAVDGLFPFVGMDRYTLQNGDKAYIIFGSQWKVSTDKSAVSAGESFEVTAEQYDSSTGLYVPASGGVAGAVQFDSNFTATEFSTSTIDANGHARLSLGTLGDYSVGITSTGYFPNTPITVSAPVAPPSNGGSPSTGGGGGGGGSSISNNNINVDRALEFLAGRQRANGSFGSSLYTDWAAIAFGVGPQSAVRDKVKEYLKSAADNLASATDFERHAMALMSLGINPYDGTEINYIQKIVEKFDGVQVGEPFLVNDDIFAIFPLLKAGYSENDLIIQKISAFIISKQANDGSFENSVDLTSATIQALSLVPTFPNVSSALSKARLYLSSQQKMDGGFGSSFSTSWVLQAIVALGDSSLNWAKNNSTPNNYLAGLQEDDGGIENKTADEGTRIWATAYAIPAALNKTWDSIFVSFAKPINFLSDTNQSSGSGGLISNSATTTIATSTLELIVTSSSSIIEQATSTALTNHVSTLAIATTTSAKILPKQNFSRQTKTAKPVLKPNPASANQPQLQTANSNSQLAGVGTSQSGFSAKSAVSIFIGLVLIFLAVL